MKYFEIAYIIDNEEWESKLRELERRCKDLNGWTEQELFQFAVNAMPLTGEYLDFLDMKVGDLEQANK